MAAVDGARSDVERGGEDQRGAHRVEQPRGSAHIGDRVDRAGLVKMDLLERNAVHLGLGLAEPAEDLERPVLHGAREAAARDERHDLLEVSLVLVGSGEDDVDLRGGETRGVDPPAPQLETAARERRERGGERRVVGPEIDESAEDHVPAGPRECIEIERFHGAPS